MSPKFLHLRWDARISSDKILMQKVKNNKMSKKIKRLKRNRLKVNSKLKLQKAKPFSDKTKAQIGHSTHLI